MHVRSSFGSAVSSLLILNRVSCVSWALAGTTEITCLFDMISYFPVGEPKLVHRGLGTFPRKRVLCPRPLRSRLRTGMLISVILLF